MYILLTINIKEEEKDLAAIFGEKYIEYAAKVDRVLFFPPFYNY
jgi:protein-S-isoprenylcysteine O-methyltransferase Ste14